MGNQQTDPIKIEIGTGKPATAVDPAMQKLLNTIKNEMSTKDGYINTLASKSIVSDNHLVSFLAEAASHDDLLRTSLRKAIDLTKTDKSDDAARYAANCITILVAARCSFWGEDLSNINIKSANLENGIFSEANFEGANLSETNLTLLVAQGAVFKKTNLFGANFGVLSHFAGHQGPVRSVSFSVDGKHAVTGSNDKTVKIWEVKTSKCVTTLEGHAAAVTTVSFSDDGEHIVSGSNDKTVKIWQVKTNKCLATLEGHTDEVRSVEFSVDGKYVVSNSGVIVKVWEAETSKCVASLQTELYRVNCARISCDGKHVALAGIGREKDDGCLIIWEVQTQQRFILEKVESWGERDLDEVKTASFSFDGKYLASTSRESGYSDQILIWRVETKEIIATLKYCFGCPTSLCFSRDGEYVAVLDTERVLIFKVETQEHVQTILCYTGVPEGCLSLSFSGGKYVVSSLRDNTVQIWDTSVTQDHLIAIQSHTNSINSLSISHDGRYVASSSLDCTVKIWEVNLAKCLVTLKHDQERALKVKFSPDGKYVAILWADHKLSIWEMEKNKWHAGTVEGPLTFHSFSGADGEYLVLGCKNGTIKIWETKTSKQLATLEGHTEYVRYVSFSGDGKAVVSCSGDYTVKIWNFEARECFATLKIGSVNEVRFSVDGKRVIAQTEFHAVKIWEIQTEKKVAAMEIEGVKDVRFSGDEKYILSWDARSVKIWEMETLNCLSNLEVPNYYKIDTVSCCPDGKHLAISFVDEGGIEIWINNNGRWSIKNKMRKERRERWFLNVSEAAIEETVISLHNQNWLETHGARVKTNVIEVENDTEVEMKQTTNMLNQDEESKN